VGAISFALTLKQFPSPLSLAAHLYLAAFYFRSPSKLSHIIAGMTHGSTHFQNVAKHPELNSTGYYGEFMGAVAGQAGGTSMQPRTVVCYMEAVRLLRKETDDTDLNHRHEEVEARRVKLKDLVEHPSRPSDHDIFLYLHQAEEAACSNWSATALFKMTYQAKCQTLGFMPDYERKWCEARKSFEAYAWLFEALTMTGLTEAEKYAIGLEPGKLFLTKLKAQLPCAPSKGSEGQDADHHYELVLKDLLRKQRAQEIAQQHRGQSSTHASHGPSVKIEADPHHHTSADPLWDGKFRVIGNRKGTVQHRYKINT